MALSSLGRVTLFNNGIIKESGGVDTADPDERFRFQALNLQSLQLLQVRKFEEDLVKLNTGYSKILKDICMSNEGDLMSTGASAPYYMNQMITFSSITTLYGFYFNTIPRMDIQRNLHDMALRKMVHCSEKVASLTQEVLKNLDPAHIPISMCVTRSQHPFLSNPFSDILRLAWILLPTTLVFVQQSGKESFKHASSLLKLPELLVSRFEGASSINALLRDVASFVALLAREKESKRGGIGYRRQYTDDAEMESKVDALRQSMKLLDLDLAHGHSSL
ncbi:hypothetical protein N0V90_005019 [Kalmusia sp. IMI 367209]|nr:hypothetical protein N0V90_005019 [Kalmusia sp. IMI 367209]